LGRSLRGAGRVGVAGEFGVWGHPACGPRVVCAAWERLRWVGRCVGVGEFGVAGEFGVWGHPACGPRVSPWVVVLRGGLGRFTDQLTAAEPYR